MHVLLSRNDVRAELAKIFSKVFITVIIGVRADIFEYDVAEIIRRDGLGKAEALSCSVPGCF